ncbi:MAG: asparagine synthase (glutamine-hydrolyzing) [Chitinophagaceae bacterium]|nr:asparagine synthase (glutamine-hydrolyzing) [Chitinophagaceae bacterium]
MCGIAGLIFKQKNTFSELVLKQMCAEISHRGIDGKGFWISDNNQVGFGHQRLSIIDLTANGHQPMHYLKRYTITFNGEIYNYIELREKMINEGYTFHSQTDTEVLLALYDFKKEHFLNDLDGMFAFAIYDKEENVVFCARDRFGEKPFYYFHDNEKFVFASELKSLWAADIPKEKNEQMWFNYLAYGFQFNPNDLSETFYKNCFQLKHSHFITLNLNTFSISQKKYYDIDYKKINSTITVDEAEKKIEELLSLSVSRRLRSDVAVGSSLSGGLDSSILVSLINKIAPEKQQSFSAVFPGYKNDERIYIDLVLENKTIDAHFCSPSANDFASSFDNFIFHQEEPVSDASVFAQYKVMQLAKEKNCTVLLDGQGADELFAGYETYYNTFLNEIKNKNDFAKQKKNIQPFYTQKPTIASKIKASLGKNAFKFRLLKLQTQQKLNPFFDNSFYKKNFNKSFQRQYQFGTLNEHLYHDFFCGPMQQLLRYADRNSMAHGREVRLPFLFHELVEFVFSLPAEMKIELGWRKYILRKSFESILPESIAWRKDKIAYDAPQEDWMREKIIVKKIQDEKTNLIKLGWISENQLNKKVYAERAHESNGNQWRMLNSTFLFEK